MRSRRIPFWLKLAYTAFLGVLVPSYWHDYGPTNFLYFCDVSLFFALGAMWLESPLLASMPAVGILLPQSLWMIDLLGEVVGLPMTGLTGYMFDPAIPLFTRALSLFHFWLPILLVFLVWRLDTIAAHFASGRSSRGVWCSFAGSGCPRPPPPSTIRCAP